MRGLPEPTAGRVLFEIEIRGRPRPQGSKSHRLIGWRPGSKKRPTVILYEAGKDVKRWRKEATSVLATCWGGRPPLEGPIQMRADFRFGRPKSHLTSTGRVKASAPTYPGHSIGDLSKLIRALEDSIDDAGIIGDDSQIVVTIDQKRYVDPTLSLPFGNTDNEAPGVTVQLWSYE